MKIPIINYIKFMMHELYLVVIEFKDGHKNEKKRLKTKTNLEMIRGNLWSKSEKGYLVVRCILKKF